MKALREFAFGALLVMASGPVQAHKIEKVAHGVIVTPDAPNARPVRVLVYGDRAFRISSAPGGIESLPPSLMVVAQPQGDFTVETRRDAVLIKTSGATAAIALADGRVRVTDARGRPLLAEAAQPAPAAVQVDGQPYYRVTRRFNPATDEGFYGLGQHQNRQMNYNGEDVELAQHNMDIAVPFVVSTRNYGLLWDNDGISRFGNPHAYALAGTDGLKVSNGGKPGWRADYFLGDRLAVSRQEAAIDYPYIRDQAKWPEAAKARRIASPQNGQNTAGNVVGKQRVVWSGTLVSPSAGLHRFRLYSSSYVKVFANGRQVLERWRQNWNPWYHNFDVPMAAGKPVALRIEWEPNAGYIALLHNDPQPTSARHSLTFTSDVAKGTDYYVVTGTSADDVIAGYRYLTGKASLLPKWAFGFWQSRQRYETQDQLLGVVREYRKRAIPLDNIVQDWFYWPEDQWGSHAFDAQRYPDPKAMVDAVHTLNARVMISVWPKFYPNTDNAKALAAKGWLYPGSLAAGYRDWVGPGYLNTDYDAYARGARDLYFAQIKTALVDKGFDAWWLDATEPDMHSNLSIDERIADMGPTAFGPGAALFNSYPLVHAQGMAEHLRVAQPDRRPFILTRSGFGGLQRASSAVWSGDLAARWDDLHDQISAGVNLSLSGLPYWTHDIGGFAVEDRYARGDPAHLAEWRELNLRWFQFGAFSPLFRSHGESPKREIYEIAANDPAMAEAMLGYDRLRYRLMPYIYTIGADAALKDGTIMRGLAMDFAHDRAVWGVDDEYMFGPAFLVAPVTRFGARSRAVYLPAGSGWYDFADGRYYPGGRSVTIAAPRERMPLLVRAGAIVPTGPAIQWSGEQPGGALVLHVFTGANGAFDLYEDDGTSADYARGGFARVPLRWDEKAQTLTIGKRQGGYAGMPATRAISVRFHVPGKPEAPDMTDNPAFAMTYSGAELRVRFRP